MKVIIISWAFFIGFFAILQGCEGKTAAPAPQLITPPPLDSFHCAGDECIYYRVQGNLYPLKQPTKNACWATVLTMLLSWKEQRTLSIEEAVQRFGPTYSELFKHSDKTGVGLKDEINLYRKAGLEIMQQLEPSIDGWAYYLKENGPLSVTVDANPPYGGTVHALLVTGIYGKKDASNTAISYIDPLSGTEHLVHFVEFMKMYEAKHAVDWEIQIVGNKSLSN